MVKSKRHPDFTGMAANAQYRRVGGLESTNIGAEAWRQTRRNKLSASELRQEEYTKMIDVMTIAENVTNRPKCTIERLT
jgi:hypothetical protein